MPVRVQETKVRIGGKDSSGRAFGSAQDNIRKTKSVSERMTAAIKKHWVLVTAGIAAAAVAIRKGWDAALDAARFQQSMQAFSTMVEAMGKDATDEFARIKAAAANMIDDKTIVEASNRAMSLGIPIERIGQLMEIARAKARDMGTDVSTAFSDIVTGIGRASPMILDNLGLIIKIGEANEKYAESIGKTVKQMTAADKKMAVLNATIEAGTEALNRHDLAVKTDNERIQEFGTNLKNITLGFGNFAKAILVKVIPAMNSFIERWNLVLFARERQKLLIELKGIEDRMEDHMTAMKRIAADGFWSFFYSDKDAARADAEYQKLLIRAEQIQALLDPRFRGAEPVEPEPEEPGDGVSAEDFETVYGQQLENFQFFLDSKHELLIEDKTRELETTINFDQLIANAERKEAQKRLQLEQQASKAIMAQRFAVANSTVNLLNILGQKSKEAALLGIAIATALEMARSWQATQTAAMLAYASQLIPGDPTSIARAAAAARATIFWGKVNLGLIAAAGALNFATTASGGGGGAGAPSLTGGGTLASPTVTTPAAVATEVAPIRVERIVIITEAKNADEIAEELIPALRRADARGVH